MAWYVQFWLFRTNGLLWSLAAWPETPASRGLLSACRWPAPAAGDRTVACSVRAHATVTAADGRTFTTIDGGETWRPV
jgi:hypothetical protein